MHPSPIHFLVLISALHPCNIPPPQRNSTTTTSKQTKIIALWELQCVTVSVCHTIYPFAQTALLANIHCNQLLVWFEAPCLLLYPQHRILTETPLGYPFVTLYHGDPATLDLQERPAFSCEPSVHG